MMKNPITKYTTVGAFCLNLCLAGSPLVAQEKVPEEGMSKHFNSVAKHLELGGEFFGYMDVDGDVAKLTEAINNFVEAMEAEGAFPKGLDLAGMVKELGLDSVTAIGGSSRKKGEVFHNRAFIEMEKGAKGLMTLWGGKAAPLTTPAMAPKGSDLVVEQDISVGKILDIIRGVLKHTGDPNALKEFEKALDQPMNGLPFSTGEFIAKLETKFVLIGTIDMEKMISPPGQEKVKIPLFDLAIGLDNADWLYKALAEKMVESKEFEKQSGDDFEAFVMTKPMGGDMDYLKPMFYLDKNSKRCYFATRPAYLEQIQKGGDTLDKDATFIKATEGFPKEGSGLVYTSPRLVKGILHVFDEAMKQNKQANGAAMRKYMEMWLPETKEGLASFRANLPDGMLFVSNQASSHKVTLLSAGLYPVALMGAGMSFFMARGLNMAAPPRQLDQAPRAERNDGPQDAPLPPEDQVKNNLAQLAFAGEQFFLDHPTDKEVAYKDLVDGGLLFEMERVAGEDYSKITLKRSGGKIVVKLKSGKEITHEYPAVTD